MSLLLGIILIGILLICLDIYSSNKPKTKYRVSSLSSNDIEIMLIMFKDAYLFKPNSDGELSYSYSNSKYYSVDDSCHVKHIRRTTSNVLYDRLTIETFCALEYYDPRSLDYSVVMINVKEFFDIKNGDTSKYITVLDYDIKNQSVNYQVKLESVGDVSFDPTKKEIAYKLITNKHNFKSLAVFNEMIEKTGLDIGYLPTI